MRCRRNPRDGLEQKLEVDCQKGPIHCGKLLDLPECSLPNSKYLPGQDEVAEARGSRVLTEFSINNVHWAYCSQGKSEPRIHAQRRC